ncbi:hypothetical protein E2562_036861 [Oryza meyeriana var. granulata]|uniref:DUF834 domain-containing protein n=1 Tax=Oryza meyeriana var. granulata TaxID=110450 RepID=A0A6G1ED03_9ORYZ|nr:hypothetical protein E2562_036861 [Oryza meyeriana var. granulata]
MAVAGGKTDEDGTATATGGVGVDDNVGDYGRQCTNGVKRKGGSLTMGPRRLEDQRSTAHRR